ncbi:MAG: LytTR family DNA-binding domain-containing protein [Bacteroidales bacterium]|jgi:DNA-binding LytR/AlgR family response regulator|nr:LytTR family DNA-binding domain-containing protein [Bacteroidales bacterium]
MKVLIVEDETVAYESLADILLEIDPDIEIAGNTEGVSQTVKWLQNNPLPDLILMDIHLSDGSAFSIFDYINVETPIIFTTAYDEYAIDAFKVNSVDYLLKPIKSEELERALEKFGKWTRTEISQYLSRITQMAPGQKYRDKLLIPHKDQYLPVSLTNISCFYNTDKNTRVFLKDGSNYAYSKSLDQIMLSLNPADFIRANKQFIIARDSVKKITIWIDRRLLIILDVETPERIYISKNKASEFKAWIVNDI